MKNSKKKLIILMSAIAVIVLGIYCSLLMLGAHKKMYVDRADGKICTLPMSGTPIMVTVAPGLVFKLDTGADASSITDSDLAKLKDLGYKIEKKIYPVIGRNGVGSMNWTFTRYCVELPLYDYSFNTDSLGNVQPVILPESLNILHNVDFVPSSTGFSVLGVDFLQKFKIEYSYNTRSLALYLDTPAGYENLVDLKVSHNPINDLWQGNRYYLKLTVQNVENDYFIDTGLQRAMIHLPMSEVTRTSNDLTPDTVYTMLHKFPALVDKEAWVCIGDRCGSTPAWYYDSNEEPYAFNPFNFLQQDFLLDLENRKIQLRPYTASFSQVAN